MTQFCSDAGGYMVEINSGLELKELRQLFDLTYDEHWLGARREDASGDFAWSNSGANVDDGFTCWAK